MKTLIYHNGALGDFITTLPVIAAWKQQQGASITLLGKHSFGILAAAAGYVENVLPVDRSNLRFLFQEHTDHDSLRSFFLPYQALLLFTLPDSLLLTRARNFSTATTLTQPPFPNQRQHIIDYHFSLLPSPSSLA